MGRAAQLLVLSLVSLVLFSACQTTADVSYPDNSSNQYDESDLIGHWDGAHAGSGILVYTAYDFEKPGGGEVAGKLSFYRDAAHNALLGTSLVESIRFLGGARIRFTVQNRTGGPTSYLGGSDVTTTKSVYEVRLRRLGDKMALKGEGQNMNLGYTFLTHVVRQD